MDDEYRFNPDDFGDDSDAADDDSLDAVDFYRPYEDGSSERDFRLSDEDENAFSSPYDDPDEIEDMPVGESEEEPEEPEDSEEETEDSEEETEEPEESEDSEETEESEDSEEEPEEPEDSEEEPEESEEPEDSEETEESEESEPVSEAEAAEGHLPAISADLIRGHINTIILRSLYDGDKYGYEIIAEIERKSHKQYSLKQPSLYSALKRLEKDGYITSYWGGSVSGGRRKYFSLTDEGKEIAERNQTEWEYSRTVIDSLISDKDFDFAQPAPAAVDMRVLRRSTSRVPDRESDEGEFEYDEPDTSDLDAERAAFEEERARTEQFFREREEVLRSREEAGTKREQELLEREFALRAEEERRAQLEEERKQALEAEQARLAEEARQQQEYEAEQARLAEEARQQQEYEAEQARLAEEARQRQEYEAEQARLAEEAKSAEIDRARAQALLLSKGTQNARIVEMEPFTEERAHYEQMLRDQAESFREEHARALAEQEARIREEDEQRFRQRELQMMHQNYLNLVQGTHAEEKPDLGFYDGDRSDPTSYVYVAKPEAEREYRSILQRLFSGTVREPDPIAPPTAPVPPAPPAATEAPTPPAAPAAPVVPENRPVPSEPPAETRPIAAPVKPSTATPASGSRPRAARSLEGIDFYDLESRAAQDGIKISTSGGRRKELKEKSDSLVHKGKALFFSALIVFLLCLAEGSIALGFQNRLSLPIFYPYFIWGTGLALLLVTFLLMVNRYGERSLRQTGNLMVNVIVAYALCIIIILIVALVRQIDFTDGGQLAAYIIFPLIYFFSIVVFGIAYYLQVRPNQDE